MSNKISNTDPGGSFQDALPRPNLETLKTILRCHGCPEAFVDPFAEGYVPREFKLGTTQFWKIRDAFYLLAKDAVSRLNGRVPFVQIGLNAIMTSIAEVISSNGLLFSEASSVSWGLRHSSAGYFAWPSSCPSYATAALCTSCRLLILNSIWALHPKMLAVDFSSGLTCFSDTTCVQSLIENALKSEPAPQLASTSTGSVTDEVQRLLEVLQDGPKTASELMSELGASRAILRNHFLGPAREMGIVAQTELASNHPVQRYSLVSTPEQTKTEVNQVPQKAEPSSTIPVGVHLKSRKNQAEAAENGIISPIATSIVAGGHVSVRLVRYNRNQEMEKDIIHYDRVERFTRNAFSSEKWKEFGIVLELVAQNSRRQFFCNGYLFNPQEWGPCGGIVLRAAQFNGFNYLETGVIVESDLLPLFAQTPGMNLAACSESERTVMARLARVFTPSVFNLTRTYAQKFGISRDLDKPYHGGTKAMQPAAVEVFNTYHSVGAKILFQEKELAQQLQLLRIDLEAQTLLLPIIYCASAEKPDCYCMMPELPDTPVLYNSDLISSNPGATIILSDEIGIPLVNDNDSDYIFSSWYGGMDVIDKLDKDLLAGRHIQWLCFDNENDPRKKYEKALKMASIVQERGGDVDLHIFDKVTWTRNAFNMETGIWDSSRVLSFDELKNEASNYGVGVKESIEVAELQDNSLDELMELNPPEPVVDPVLWHASYCLFYGGSGTAKTWIGLHLGIALSQGVDPFKEWKFKGGSPLNVLYIAGEMRKEVYGDRIRKLLKDQDSNPLFRFVRADLDLTTEEDKKKVIKLVEKRKSQVVFFDNLSTLANNGHLEGQYRKFHSLILELQARGLIVGLIHHENRNGGYKGTGLMELRADQTVHLFLAAKSEKIEVLVQSEKVRMTSRAEQASFHATFDPEHPEAGWKTKPLTQEERNRLDEDDPFDEVEANNGKKRRDHRLAWRYMNDEMRAISIIDDMLSGCHDDVIAANLAVRLAVIVNFKQEYGISEETVAHALSEIENDLENELKNIKTDDLAPKVWNYLETNKKEMKRDGTAQI